LPAKYAKRREKLKKMQMVRDPTQRPIQAEQESRFFNREWTRIDAKQEGQKNNKAPRISRMTRISKWPKAATFSTVFSRVAEGLTEEMPVDREQGTGPLYPVGDRRLPQPTDPYLKNGTEWDSCPKSSFANR
jgi:hypothetical protein